MPQDSSYALYRPTKVAVQPLSARIEASAPPWRMRAGSAVGGNPTKGLGRTGSKAAIVPAVKAAIAWLAFFLAAAPMLARASAEDGVFKCRGPGAGPVYQQQPCPPGTALRDFAQDPPTVSIVPFEGLAPKVVPKSARAERPVKPAGKPDKRKADADRRTSDAAVVERRHVKDGMSDGEVLARLGPPDLQSGKTGRKMRWTYLPAPGDPQTVTLLRFEDGKVVAVERSTMR